MNDYWLTIFLVPIGVVVLYIAVRFAGAAWFQSKIDYDERKNHGKK